MVDVCNIKMSGIVLGLWGVINNAGMNFFGDVEVIPVYMYERGFDVNLYGPIRVMKQFLPLIKRSKGESYHFEYNSIVGFNTRMSTYYTML